MALLVSDSTFAVYKYRGGKVELESHAFMPMISNLENYS